MRYLAFPKFFRPIVNAGQRRLICDTFALYLQRSVSDEFDVDPDEIIRAFEQEQHGPVDFYSDRVRRGRIHPAPAAFSGVVGVHPSTGLIPHADYELRSVMMTGSLVPMARSVRDAAMTLQVLSGPDGRDLRCGQGAMSIEMSAVAH